MYERVSGCAETQGVVTTRNPLTPLVLGGRHRSWEPVQRELRLSAEGGTWPSSTPKRWSQGDKFPNRIPALQSLASAPHWSILTRIQRQENLLVQFL